MVIEDTMLRSRPNVTTTAASGTTSNSSGTNQKGGISGTVKRRKTRSRTKAGYQNGSSLERVIGMVALCLIFGVALMYISNSNNSSDIEISPYEYQKKRLYHRNQQQQQQQQGQNHRNVRARDSSSLNIPNPESISHHTNKKNQHHKQQHQQQRDHNNNHNLTSIYNLQYPSIDGEVIPFSKFIGSVALIINVASE